MDNHQDQMFCIIKGFYTGYCRSKSVLNFLIYGYPDAKFYMLATKFHSIDEHEILDNIMRRNQKRNFYAVARGWNIGIYDTVTEAMDAKGDYPDGLSKKFFHLTEAMDWIRRNALVFKQYNTLDVSLCDTYYVLIDENYARMCNSKTQFKCLLKQHQQALTASFSKYNDALLWLKTNYEKDSHEDIANNINNNLPTLTNDPTSIEVNPGTGKSTVEDIVTVRDSVPNIIASDKIKAVQFNKKFFVGYDERDTRKFVRDFRKRLRQINDILSGNITLAGHIVKLIRISDGYTIIKDRKKSSRVIMTMDNGVLSFHHVSTHDMQAKDFRRKSFQETSAYVYYDIHDFLQRLDFFEAFPDVEGGFRELVTAPSHFVLDEKQGSFVQPKYYYDNTFVDNLSLTGNAGTGKSIIGFRWLLNEATVADNPSIYLTMSDNLVYTLHDKFAKEFQVCDNSTYPSSVKVISTFNLMRKIASKAYPDIPENSYLNTHDSFGYFKRAWLELGFNRINAKFISDLFEMWRVVHGIIGGAMPDPDLKRMTGWQNADYALFVKMQKKEFGCSWGDKFYEYALKIYRKYKALLKKEHKIDDNDMAKKLLALPNIDGIPYMAVFIDECQDLTQVQIVALYHVFHRAKSKRIASDRCQMVQPTYFDERAARTFMYKYDLNQHKCFVDNKYSTMVSLKVNYRSTAEIVALQNYLIRTAVENNLLTLSADEAAEITVPKNIEPAVKPIIIKFTDNNEMFIREHLLNGKSGIIPIFADSNAETLKNMDIETGTAMDVTICKGMEYPYILSYNILTDRLIDTSRESVSMAWRYFYVGITRATKCLLIIEENRKGLQLIDKILEQAIAEQIVDFCSDVAEEKAVCKTWGQYILEQTDLCEEYDYQDNIENALTAGLYEMALEMVNKLVGENDFKLYCKGKVLEQKKLFTEALRCYQDIHQAWHNHGRNKYNAADTIVNDSFVDCATYVKAFLHQNDDHNSIDELFEAFYMKFKHRDNLYAYLDEAISDGYGRYAFDCWCKEAARKIKENIQGIADKATFLTEYNEL